MTEFARNDNAPTANYAETPNKTDVLSNVGELEPQPLNCRVVVAEDETVIRLDLVETLAEAGCEIVGEASDGRAALDLIRELDPDLVVLDVKMPEMDGLSVAEELHSTAQAAVVMVTAFSDPTSVKRAVDAGAAAYVVKPFTAMDLIPAVQVALARHAQLLAVQSSVTSLTDQLKARKTLDRAKGLLMEKFKLSEPDAFRWIQKSSMDQRVSMEHVSERIIEELLGAATSGAVAK